LTHYAVATLEELWSNDRLTERRLSHGEAREDERGIVAIDNRDDALVDACERAMNAARACCVAPNRRILVEATRANVATIVVLRDGVHSLVTDPDNFDRDAALLRSIASRSVEAEPESLPIVWRNGSAAVLLHEAIGHALEYGHEPIAWPSWLEIDVPLASRRASFRDVPLQRMMHLVARQRGATLDVPRRRIDVLLLDGGAYEPLTQRVTLRVSAADLIDGENARGLPPFTITKTRSETAAALAGAAGESIRYPGVICSREGQELLVPSSAPDMLTVFG
jgi:hypothetical protein